LDVKDVEGVANPDYIELVKQLTSFQTGPLVGGLKVVDAENGACNEGGVGTSVTAIMGRQSLSTSSSPAANVVTSVALAAHLSAPGSLALGPQYMRVGAYSADRLVAPWNGTVYFALARLHRATGVKFIMGVNQHAEDEAVTQMQVKRSQQLLPPGSIVSFAVGNEPDM
jgi:hypothetical protein